MKKLLTLICLTTFTLLGFSQEKNYNVTITVKGAENQLGILAYYFGDKRYVKDSLFFDAKGVASIKGKKNIQSGVYLLAFPSMRFNSFDLLLKETDFSITTDTVNFIKNAVVKNSVENKQMFDDMNYMIPLGLENDSLQKRLKTLKKGEAEYTKTASAIEDISKKIIDHRKETIKKHPTTFYSKLMKTMLDIEVPSGPRKPDGSLVDTFYNFHYTQQHYFDNIDFADSGLIRSPVFQSKLIKYFDAYTYPQPDSIYKAVDFVINKTRVNKEMYQYVLNELFMKYAKSEIMGQDAVYIYIAEKYYLSGEAWWAEAKGLTELRDRVEAIKPTLIGKIAPNFFVQDSLNKSHMFHDFVPKHKYNVLVFWNSDCSHCQHEIPRLKQLYLDSLKAMNVGVFAVSTEQTDSSFRAFAAKNCAPDWITAADMRGQSAFRKEYDIIATPKVFLITPDYKIIAKNIPLNNLVEFIKFQYNINGIKNIDSIIKLNKELEKNKFKPYSTTDNNNITNDKISISDNSIKIKIEKKNSTKTIPIKINDLKEIDFIFDTGASETTITADVVSVLIRQKIISKDDFLPGKSYKLADGSIVKSPRFIIKKLEIGNEIFNNVEATIVSSQSDPLLGQNILKRFKKVTQDNQNGYVVFEKY